MYRNALLIGAGVVAVAPVLAAASLPASVQTAIDKGDYVTAESALKEQLRTTTLSTSDEQAMHLCMVLELIRETGAQTLTGFAAGNTQKAAFLREFTGDAGWLELYLTAGLVPYQTEVGVDVLYRIWADQHGKVRNKPLATALASVWGGGKTDPNPPVLQKDPSRFNPVWRYNFFEGQLAKGLLHPDFKNLRPWELRFCVGIPGQDWDDQSYAWAAENINLPWDKYGSACWAATYTDPSKFGDSVQCGLYNLPFSEESDAETTQRNGGVCGALSHLGTVAAMAHGIPAYTVGQPGHCAYGVRVERGHWSGGFGGPDGTMHNRIFGKQAPTSYNLMEAVFADDATIAAAYRETFVARAKEAVGDTAGARASWGKALALAPLHPFFRTELHRLMLADGLTPQDCFTYLKKTLPLYQGHGVAAVEMAADLQPLVNQLPDDQKVELYTDMHVLIAGTPASWATKCDGIVKAQFGTLGSDAAKEKLLGQVLAAHVNSADGTFFGQLLEWAVKEYVETGKAETFARAFNIAAQQTKAGDSSDKKRTDSLTKAYGKAIVAAEAARSAVAFKALSQAAAKALGGNRGGGVPREATGMPGKLTVGVLFRESTTSSWDDPTQHAAIMTPAGGRCHTSKETAPHFIVELRNQQTLAGCLIRKADGNEGRMRKAVVYTSSDGATWMKRAETADMPKVWTVKFPAGTTGKWVKIEFENPGSGDFAHISHFLIYTK